MKYHEMSPHTGRTANTLATVYDGDIIENMAADLPVNASVIDIGAGQSDFGAIVAHLRPDVSWVNADMNYGRRGHALRPESFGVDLPNLSHVPMDILNPTAQPESFDRVFSSALLPHIRLTSEALALKAFHNMARLLRSTGQIAVTGFSGEYYDDYLGGGFSYGNVQKFTARQYHTDPDTVAKTVVDAMNVGSGAWMHKMSNLWVHYVMRHKTFVERHPPKTDRYSYRSH